MELLNTKKARKKKGMVRSVIGATLAATLIINPLGSVGPILPEMEVKAASFPAGFEVPDAIGYPVLNDMFAGNATYYRANRNEFNLAGRMKSVSLNKALEGDRYWDGLLSDVQLSGRGTWSAVYEYDLKDGDATGFSKELEVKFGGTVSNYNGSYISLSNGGDLATNDKNGTSNFATDWLPWDGVSNPKAVVNGKGDTFIDYMYYIVADRFGPGEKGWEYAVEEEEGTGKPVIRLTCTDTLRPANKNITTSDLNRMRIKLKLLPSNDPSADFVYCTAQAVAVGDDLHSLEFRILDADWETLKGQNYRIMGMENASSNGYFALDGYAYKVTTAVTDYVGNPVEFKATDLSDVKDPDGKRLEIDMQSPSVVKVLLTGSHIDDTEADVPEDPKNWPEDIDKNTLYAGAGDAIRFSLYLSELIVPLSGEDMTKVALEWNVKDHLGNPIVTPLVQIGEALVNGENGNRGSVLTFDSRTMSFSTNPQGEKIRPVKILNAHLLKDESSNAMVEAKGGSYEITLAPNRQNYLDSQGPTADLLQVIPNKTPDVQSAEYTFEINIQDGDNDYRSSGIEANTCKVALTSYRGAPKMQYEYVINQVPDFPETFTGSGEITAEGNRVYHDFQVVTAGKYYLHVKLTNLEGKELSDEQGLTLNWYLVDEKNNGTERSCRATELSLDFNPPEVAINAGRVDAERSWDDATQTNINKATLNASISATDLNGIDRVVHQWVEPGMAAEEDWMIAYSRETATELPEKLNVQGVVTGLEVVESDVVVRVYDIYGNYTEKRLTMSADLSKAVPQYEEKGNFDVPSMENDIIIYPSISSTESQTVKGWTRVIVDMGDAEGYQYVHIIEPSQTDGVGVLDDSSTSNWYKVKIKDNTYNVMDTFSSLPDYYGNINVNIVSSFEDLTPVYNGLVDAPDDTTRSNAINLSIPYASKKDNVYRANVNSIQNSAGEEQTYNIKNGYTYYKLDQTMTGARFCYTLSNYIMPDWGVKDVDFDKSYAVLLKTDAKGQYAIKEDGSFDESCEVTAHIPLSNSAAQTFSIPGTDLSGNVFETGVYMLKVHIVQKAGAEQDFYFENKLLLLDASEVPTRFGIFEYNVTAETESDDNRQEPQWVIAAAEGAVLPNISIGVAKPDGIYGEEDARTLVNSYGFPAYVMEKQNALSFSKRSYASTYVTLMAELPKIPEQWFANEEGKNGIELGTVTGIKYWNAASTGNPKDLAYYTSQFISSDIPWIEEKEENGKRYYSLPFSIDMGWYAGDTSDVVSQEALAAKPLDDFAVTLGANTICYQLQLSNGAESPIYQFQMNLCEEVPTLELICEPPMEPKVWKPIKRMLEENKKTEDIQKIYVPYMNVTVKDSFSPNSSVKLFHAKLDDYGNYGYTEIQVGQTVQFTESSIGYLGSEGTALEGTVHKVKEFICAIDNTGNAVSAYPILKKYGDSLETGDYRFVYEILSEEECDLFSAKWCEPNDLNCFEDTNETVHRIAINYDNYDDLDDAVEYLMVQLDDGEPVRINTRLSESVTNDILKDYNAAGIIGYEEELYLGDGNNKDVIQFVLPYDETRAEGEAISHKMTITGYSWSDETNGLEPVTKTVEFDITGTNRKPTVELKAEPFTDRAGEVLFGANTYVKADGNTEYALEFSKVIYESGRYKLKFMDKYGVEYEQVMEIPENVTDPKVTASTTDLTVGPVVITITSENYNIYLSDSVKATLPEGTLVDGNHTKQLTLTFKKNTAASGITVNYTKQVSGADASLAIVVDNIVENAQAIEPEVQWSYSEYDIEEGNVIRGNVTAMVVDRNGSRLLDPLTGKAPSYVFTPGGETSYTFTDYENEYGVKGTDIVAELPVTLLPLENAAQESDVYSPDFALTGYAIRNNISREVQGAFVKKNVRPEGVMITQVEETPIGKYGAENTFTNLDGFMNKLGWADSYMLRVDVADENAVHLFVKSQLYGETPDYATGTSDVIEGVELSGRTLTISQNTEFVLYAVDEKGNSSAILLEITALGDAPEPTAAQVLAKDGGEVRIFLLPPNIEGVTNLTITNDVNNDKQYDTKLEEDTESIFNGMYYLPVTENGELVIQYSYEYDGITYTGQLLVTVRNIDTEPAELVVDDKGGIHWSANYDVNGERYTNQQITAQMQFNKPLKNVKLTVAGSNEDVTAGVPGLTVIWLENLVTVIYEVNVPKLQLTVEAAVNGKTTTIDLPEISTIDMGEPIVSNKVEYSANHRKALVTLTSDEPGVLQESGKASETVNENGVTRYIFKEEVGENGKFTFVVTDRAGNIGSTTVNVTGVVDALQLDISTAGSEESIINPATYEAKIGETLYVRSNRAAIVTMNGNEAGSTDATTWLPIVIGEDAAGLYPCISATDSYGNTTKVQMLYISLGDRKAPIIIIKKKMVSASREDRVEDIDKLLKENITIRDDTTSVSNLVVDVDYDMTNQSNKIPVTYTVTDEAGNQTVGNCVLRLYTGNESEVTVNGKEVQWDETIIVEKGMQTITVKADGEPYRFDWKVGIKTAAQLKINAMGLTSGYTSEKEMQYEVELTDTGFYTFLITTQGRNEYRFVLYVEE